MILCTYSAFNATQKTEKKDKQDGIFFFTKRLNIAENEASGIYSREKVIQQNPEIILIATMGTSKKAAEMEKKRWMAFSGMDAVKTVRIHVLDPETVCSPTPVSFIKGVKELLPLIHPRFRSPDVARRAVD